jgi:hypothetical protein
MSRLCVHEKRRADRQCGLVLSIIHGHDSEKKVHAADVNRVDTRFARTVSLKLTCVLFRAMSMIWSMLRSLPVSVIALF